MTTTRLKAVGTHIFAGGFTWGVKDHFDVEAVLEKDKYGVATAEANMPDIRHVVGYDRWPAELDRLKPQEWDFVYGNPPCAAWSNAGAATKKGRTWDSSSLPECTLKHFELLEQLRPKVWAWESVQRAWTVGRDFVDALAIRARDLGYSVTILLHDAQNVGVPQKRQRFFFVAHRVPFNAIPPGHDDVSKTIDEALRELNDPGEPLERNLGKHRAILDAVRQGENLSGAWDRLTPKDQQVVGTRGQMVGRPPFTIKRARSGQPAPVVMHEILHPTEARGLSIKELAYLCGFPAMYEFVGANDAGQIGRGVCPPVGRWLAASVKKSIEDFGGRDDRDGPRFRLVDYTDRKNLIHRSLDWPTPKPAPVVVNLMSELKSAIDRSDAAAIADPDEMVQVDPTHAVPRGFMTPNEVRAMEQVDVVPNNTLLTDESVRVDAGGGAAIALHDVKPKPGLGSGAYMRVLIGMGLDTQRILDMVHRHYPESKAAAGDVSYNRRKLKQDVLAKERAVVETSKVGEVQTLRTGPRLSVDPAREFDKTSLRDGAHGQWVHRDYAAHFFRWSFAGRYSGSEVDILDVGCGPDVPMINALTMPRSNVPRSYVGVDMNRQPKKAPSRQWATLHWEFNFIERHAELGTFNLITSFEVVEHMRKPDGERFLAAIASCLRDRDARAIISTPVFNGKAAANHLHEWTIDELAASIDAAGMCVVDRFGTFASWNEIKKVATPEQVELAKRLARWYDGEVISCFLAPLYPDASRNNAWVLQKKA